MENQPTHFVYQVREIAHGDNEEKRDFWTKIGAAWPHKDGDGFSIAVDLVPLTGRIVLRKRPEEDERPAREGLAATLPSD